MTQKTTSLLLVALATASAFNDTTTLNVQIPQSLYKPEGFEHSHATFGFPMHAGTIAEYVIYANQPLCFDVNSSLAYPQIDDEPFEPPFIVMIDRGDCTFADKIRFAQFLGASAVVIADNQCVCGDETCTSEHPGETCQSGFPEITGDGSENDISIPSFLLNRHDASVLIEELRGNHPMQMQLSWGWEAKERVEYSIWSSPHDSHGTELVKNLKHIAVALGSDAAFTPHMSIHGGERYGCTKHAVEDGMESCANLCTNSGRYCALDHHVLESDGKTYTTITGATTVEESLRRLCIWKHYGETDGVGAQWWNYIEEFNSRCGNRPEFFGNADCIRDTFNHVKIDSVMIEECMRDSGGVIDGLNTLFEAELKAKEAHGIVKVPSVLINGVPMKAPLNTWTIFYSLCDAFAYDAHYPEVCERCRWRLDLETCVGTGGDIADTPKPRKKHRARAFWITFFVLGILGGVGYYFYKKSRDEESNIIADYMPFVSSSSGV